MPVIDLLRALAKRGVLIVLGLLLVGLAVFAVSLTRPKVYTSGTEQFISFTGANSPNQLQSGAAFTTSQMQSFGQLAVSAQVLQPVIDKLGLGITVDQLRDRIVATTPRNTVILQIEVDADSPQLATQIAATLSSQLAEVITDIGPKSSNGDRLLAVRTIQNATTPTEPSSPQIRRDTLLGALAGLALGAAATLLLVRRDDVVTSPAVLARTVAAPLLGSVPSRYAVHSADRSAERVGDALGVLLPERGSTTIMVTAPTARAGSAETALQLASGLSRDRSVVLVDCRLRGSELHRLIGREKSRGVRDAMLGHVPVEMLITTPPHAGFDLVGAGTPGPAAPLTAHGLRGLLGDLRQRYDVVVVEAGPVLAVVDPVVVGAQADLVVLVADTDATLRDELARSVQILGLAGIETTGVVLSSGARDFAVEPGRPLAELAPARSTG